MDQTKQSEVKPRELKSVDDMYLGKPFTFLEPVKAARSLASDARYHWSCEVQSAKEGLVQVPRGSRSIKMS